jgi:hypothetical protein
VVPLMYIMVVLKLKTRVPKVNKKKLVAKSKAFVSQ